VGSVVREPHDWSLSETSEVSEFQFLVGRRSSQKGKNANFGKRLSNDSVMYISARFESGLDSSCYMVHIF